MSQSFAARLLAWFDQHGRRDLPWQHPREPYRVWLAEIMLQQTQVATVIPYFERFVRRFPDINALATAPLDDVLALWSGLGYYARARNLHRCAQALSRDYSGQFPRELSLVLTLPGIGRSTAGAVLAQAYGQRHPILDGNVRRVLARHAMIDGWPGQPQVQKQLWALAEALLPDSRLADYTQAQMDLGATLCTARKPSCARCPVAEDCRARLQGVVSAYPLARPKRQRPVREARVLLLVRADGQVLMERRPPVGIWGGLWSLPMLESPDDDEARWCMQRDLQPEATVESLSLITHGFTHFELKLHPRCVRVREGNAVHEPDRWRWVNITPPIELGLPAPIRKLLQTFSG